MSDVAFNTRETGTHAKIESTGAYRPERIVTNDELAPAIDSSDEWIESRSGIKSRRFARDDESAADMATKAAEMALERGGFTGNDIDVVIGATITHGLFTPSLACMVAGRIDATPAAAFDLGAACSGFCHGIGVATDMLRAGTAKRVLVVGVEKMTDFLDLTDRGTAFIFGDGAGAAIIGPSDVPHISPTVWGSDGEKCDLIIQQPSTGEAKRAFEAGTPLDVWPTVRMEGRSVFRWAIWDMAPVVHNVLDAAGVKVDDLDCFVPHQANLRITEGLVKKLQLPEHVKVAKNIVDTGNTSGASVGIALHQMIVDGEAKSGDVALLFGFGSGLAYAGQVVVIP